MEHYSASERYSDRFSTLVTLTYPELYYAVVEMADLSVTPAKFFQEYPQLPSRGRGNVRDGEWVKR